MSSNSLLRIVKHLKIPSYRYKFRFLSNPSSGLEYNKINKNRLVSRRIYTADIAHDSQVINNKFEQINVQAKAANANAANNLVNNMKKKFKGRT